MIRREPKIGKRTTINESEMALLYECIQSALKNVLDTADIVRDRDLSAARQFGPVFSLRI